jgi:hypothetical protein
MSCSVTAHSDGWNDALTDSSNPYASGIYEWLAGLEAAGCSTPAYFDYLIGTNLWLTTCPVGVRNLPRPKAKGARTFEDLTIYCNACVPVAPAGYVTVAFNFEKDLPQSDCVRNGCISPPDPNAFPPDQDAGAEGGTETF